MDSLESLDAEDRELVEMLKANRDKRTLIKYELEQQQIALREAEQAALRAKIEKLTPLTVLGVTQENIRKLVKDSGLRVVPVHPDVLKLLRAALPARDEQHFYQLCSALIQRLSINPHLVRAKVDELKASSDTKYYFESEDSSVVVHVTGKLTYLKTQGMTDGLTVFALEWGKAIHFEDESNGTA